jgi:hypothetical protein
MKIFSGIGIAMLALGVATAAAASDDLIRCSFGKGECNARIRICPTSEADCRATLTVDCVDYEDGYFTRRVDNHVLFQGITSLRNPTPPAILIEADGDSMRDGARLFTSGGILEGRCRSGD